MCHSAEIGLTRFHVDSRYECQAHAEERGHDQAQVWDRPHQAKRFSKALCPIVERFDVLYDDARPQQQR